MDTLSLLRTLGGLGTVLGILAAALWLVRRFDLKLPGRVVRARDRRLELVETLPIDSRRIVALLRRDGREHLVLIAPEGNLVLETCVVRDDVDHAAADARRSAREAATLSRDQQREQSLAIASENFGNLIDRAVARTTPVIDRACARATPVALAVRAQLNRAYSFRKRMPPAVALKVPPALLPLPSELAPDPAPQSKTRRRPHPNPGTKTRPKRKTIRQMSPEIVDV